MNESFTLGTIGPLTCATQHFLAAAVMFDLDFRKHFDPTLVERFGEPIVEVSDMNPNLEVRLILGSSGCEGSGLGMKTVLDWLPHDSPHVVDGILGGLEPRLTSRVLGVTAEME
eukprot:3170632-Amphidinium_carterae.1